MRLGLVGLDWKSVEKLGEQAGRKRTRQDMTRHGKNVGWTVVRSVLDQTTTRWVMFFWVVEWNGMTYGMTCHVLYDVDMMLCLLLVRDDNDLDILAFP